MADRIEREIEEILERLEEKPGGSRGASREPIPLKPRRKKGPSLATRVASSSPAVNVSPATLLFTGAGIMILGLIAASFADAFIWLAFAGVVVFLVAFVWSFMRRTTPGAAPSQNSPRGGYWRDRYIEYDDTGDDGGIEKFKRVFRRR